MIVVHDSRKIKGVVIGFTHNDNHQSLIKTKLRYRARVELRSTLPILEYYDRIKPICDDIRGRYVRKFMIYYFEDKKDAAEFCFFVSLAG